MPIYMKLQDIQGEQFADLSRVLAGRAPARWQAFPGAQALASQLRRQHPGGVDTILIGLLNTPGFQTRTSSKGVIAILIGLLLPAVQKLHEPTSADRRALTGALKGSGQLAFAMCDGSVRIAGGRSIPTAAGGTHIWGDPHIGDYL